MNQGGKRWMVSLKEDERVGGGGGGGGGGERERP